MSNGDNTDNAETAPKGAMAMWYINQALRFSCEALAEKLNTPAGEVMGHEVRCARNAWDAIRCLAPIALADNDQELKTALVGDDGDEDGPCFDPEF